MGEQSIFYIAAHSAVWLGFDLRRMRWSMDSAGKKSYRWELALYFPFLTVCVEFKKKEPGFPWLRAFGKDYFK